MLLEGRRQSPFHSLPIKACLHRGMHDDSRRKKNARLHERDLREHR
jgi:hypothetical protein